MNARIVVVGSLNADLVLSLERFPIPGQTVVGREFNVHPGGKGANQAYAAARLGGQVSMVGQVGNDSHADWLKANLAAVGVDVSHVTCDPKVASGIAAIAIDAAGQNQIVVVPGANGTFGVEQIERSRALIASAKLVLLQLEIPMETVLSAARIAKEAGATLILDPAPARPLSDALLKCADYLTPNETEIALLTGATPGRMTRTTARDLARKLNGRGAANVIVKMGDQGALLSGQKPDHFWPALSVQAVDTTAAGDAFNAAFAVALAEDKSVLDAGQFATLAAACSVTRPGAQPSLPTRAEVEALARS
ncbi:MAG: ribokinase [Verrucomicrobia bacterium]|nr:ribokinase [Verrucomicrobiota bacterium]